MIFSTATSGLQDMRLPQWGRSFWQDPNDGEIFLAYGSGTTEVDFITSADSGVTWSSSSHVGMETHDYLYSASKAFGNFLFVNYNKYKNRSR